MSLVYHENLIISREREREREEVSLWVSGNFSVKG